MTRFYAAAILLLALATVVAGGFLPRIAGSWQDAVGSNREGYAIINEVSLDASSSLNIRQKLTLYSRPGDVLSLPGSMTGLTQAEVLEIVKNTVSLYQTSGLIPPLSQPITKQDMDATAYLYKWELGGEGNAIFWEVNLYINSHYRLNLTIDDETGIVFSVRFGDYMGIDGPIERSQMENRLRALCEPYLKGLGSEFSAYNAEDLIAEAEYNGVAGELYTGLNWGDIRYGEVRIQFIVSYAEAYMLIF